ncbi:TPA: GTP-binding protein [Candidatus Woesearchaeota archaeon]|nr:GTP-binding protein [Candidatus Woesearchaeota archaeon]HII68952.1 GTP-binding protein [Candidatus Woesearchaeota archaeon]
MNFQTLQKVETPDTYLDIAFRRAKEHAAKAKEAKRHGGLEKLKAAEIGKIDVIRAVLVDKFMHLLKSFPSVDHLDPFYRQLVRITLDYPQLKKSLGAMNWATKQFQTRFRMYQQKIARAASASDISAHARAFYGRIASVLKQIKEELAYLEEARKVMKGYPTIKTSIPTAVIYGFPNIGKTTLLFKLTGSKPDIKPYAFTTQNLNVSYLIREDGKKIQLIDTPGSLNRRDKMNSIEQQAELALHYLADTIVFVVDPTEASSPLELQEKLLEKVKKTKKEVLVYVAKADVAEKSLAQGLAKKYGALELNALKERLSKLTMPSC